MPDPVNEAVREKVARALWDEYQRGWETPLLWQHATQEAREGFLREADAAIAVIEAERGHPHTVYAEVDRLRNRNAGLEAALGLAADEDLGFRSSGSAAQNHEWTEDESDAMERALLAHLDEDDAMTAIQVLRPWLAPRFPQDEDHEGRS